MTYIELMTVVTAAALNANLLAAMTTANLPTSAWAKDGLWANLTNWFAILYQGLYGNLRIIAQNAFLDTATGDGLIDLGQGTYGTQYRRKTFASGTITLLNSSGAPLEAFPDTISFAKVGSPEITYRNSTSIYIANGNQLAIDVVCDIAGTTGNVLAANGPFNLEFVSTLVGVTIVSHSGFVGQDEQSPDEYRALCRKSGGRLSMAGARQAWEWFPPLLNTDGTVSEDNDGKTRVNVNRVRVDDSSPYGIINLSLASASGPVDAGEFATVVSFLQTYVLPTAGTLVATNCTAVAVNVTLSATVRKGTSVAGVAGEIAARLQAYFTLTSIGGDDGFLTVEELRGEAFRANPNIHAVLVTVPAADVALTNTQVATLGTVSIVVAVQP